MRYLVCKVDADPCPPSELASLPFLETVDFTSMGITPEALLYFFSWGFGVCFSSWLMGIGIGVAVSMTKRI